MHARSLARAARLACLLALGVGGCTKRGAAEVQAPTKEIFVLEENAAPTDIHDLELLRLRGALGQHAEVREEILPRLEAASPSAPDAGRDALRRLMIEIALCEGDAATAAAELTILERDVDRLGPAASAEAQAIVSLLYSDLAYRANYFLDARRWSLRAITLLESGSSPLLGDALTTLARSQLALNNADQALDVLLQATTQLERHAEAEYADLHEARLLKVDVFLALRMPGEAVIAAGEVYDGAIERFGGESLPHAEALLAVAAATYANGSESAARSMFTDAKQLFWDVQTKQPPSPFPVSERLVKRLNQMGELLPAAPDDDDDDDASPQADA
ncbi:MAG: hypothetical protein R3A79_21380 [Nannocystaceae bacterium]